MIFATVGTATQDFGRLISAMDLLVGHDLVKERSVFIQTGHTNSVKPKNFEFEPFLSVEKFERLMEEAEIIVCHGGSTTTIHALRLGKTPVVMPRRKKFDEHVNDHQMDLVQAMAAEGWIVPVYEAEELPAAIGEVLEKKDQKIEPQSSQMAQLIDAAIVELIGLRR
ncbi:MAG: hypothetical protein HOC91_14655 [Nitrospinaceae bacterium]|jgi:UDP-N-acetylglucosamine transferase subunit ALG13|nr:hypothetical protein [Nitrospinaceae bacterium]MBT3820498.1 hypothetical protein [Nitrospinaceae bacterium]MBT4092768.1 hypothetical protein [Nitrospinaceae bacterium]MBT4431747.1 hypothetical protein [Nitrospinaceae bacterium]MBT5369137.1 hypothetical protein [Nitrospinaceae bacterium]